ncbi:hypothetical protein BOTNAR_0307g00170 [Botryotinia narcissicola]|uniref:Uncharacterized protein n=1 Tax=Botryotinia narcissicola TaxID=278944 RepID=A0A4Z1I2R8_9HELO|nr:hypothetical protein BOTNAR_0307g00170 [Botryotinia narcissicola]
MVHSDSQTALCKYGPPNEARDFDYDPNTVTRTRGQQTRIDSSVIGITAPAITTSSQAIEELGRNRPTIVYIYLTTLQTPLSQPTTQSTKHTLSIKTKFPRREEHRPFTTIT